MSACTDLVTNASAGVSPALRAVDCVAGEMTAAAFNRLFAAEGAMAPVLTILLTLYIAFFAISLLTGRSSLGISALTPRMLTLGLVLTFSTSWIAYQGVVWNLAVGAPDWIASVLMGTTGSATQIFADRIDMVFAAIGEISQNAAGSGGGQNGTSGVAGMFSPGDIMWMGALLLMLGTVGILLTARIALAILLALGPVFVVMALFNGTRGLTAGWLRGVALTALTPLFVVLGGGITLELLVPVLAALSASFEGISGRGAMALFLIAAVHVALMAMVLKVAGTLVGNWQVFGLARSEQKAGSAHFTHPAASGAMVVAPLVAGNSGQQGTSRRPAIATASSDMHASIAGQSDGSLRPSERRTVVTHVTGGGIEPAGSHSQQRARGIGSRFRNASNDAGRLPAKENAR